MALTPGTQFELIKASAITAIQADLEAAVDASAKQAQLAALAAGAPLYPTVAEGVAGVGDGDMFLVFEEYGVGVYTRVGAGSDRLGTLTGRPHDFKEFGAVGDGVTDDTAAMQACLDEVTGDVVLSKGTYRTTGELLVKSGQNIVGAGGVISAPDGNFHDALVVRGQTGVRIQGVVVRGPFGGDAFDNAILVSNSHDVTIVGNTIESIGVEAIEGSPTGEKGFGITVGGGDPYVAPSLANGCTNIKILNNTFKDIKGYGQYRGDAVSLRTCKDVIVSGNYIGTVRRMQIAVIESPQNVTIIGNTLEGGDLSGIDVEPNDVANLTRDITIVGNTINNYGCKPGATIGSQLFGIDLHSGEWKNCVITGNVITAVTAGAGSPIHAQNTSEYAIISGNILDCAGIAATAVKLYAGNGFKDLIISDNFIKDFTYRAIDGFANDRSKVHGNHIVSSHADVVNALYMSGCEDLTVHNNTIILSSLNVTWAVFAAGNFNLAIADNTIRLAAGGAISYYSNAGAPDGIRISGNSAVSSGGTGTAYSFTAAGAGSVQNAIIEGNLAKGFAQDYVTSGGFVIAKSVQLSDIGFRKGTGLDFSDRTPGAGASSVRQRLVHYEDGVWSPVIADATTGGNVATVGTVYATYTRIGRQVTVHLQASDINVTGLTAGNALCVQGLPFPVSTSPRCVAAGSVVFDRIGSALSWVCPAASFSAPNALTFQTSSTSAATQDGTVKVSDVGSTGSDIHSMTVTYLTD